MELKIKRTHSTRLYTEGTLYINDMRNTNTVEDTLSMLPTGEYVVKLSGGAKRRRVIAIKTREGELIDGWHPTIIEAGGSYLSSRKNHSIGIGEALIPGSLYKATEIYERLFDRLEKAEQRGEETTLIICDDNMSYGEPIKYWLSPSDHGCPPSKRRVEADEKGGVIIYDGNQLVKYFPSKQEILDNVCASSSI